MKSVFFFFLFWGTESGREGCQAACSLQREGGSQPPATGTWRRMALPGHHNPRQPCSAPQSLPQPGWVFNAGCREPQHEEGDEDAEGSASPQVRVAWVWAKLTPKPPCDPLNPPVLKPTLPLPQPSQGTYLVWPRILQRKQRDRSRELLPTSAPTTAPRPRGDSGLASPARPSPGMCLPIPGSQDASLLGAEPTPAEPSLFPCALATYHFSQSRDDLPQRGQGLVDVCSFLAERGKAQALRPCFRAALKSGAPGGWASPSIGWANSSWSYWAASISSWDPQAPVELALGSFQTEPHQGFWQRKGQETRHGKMSEPGRRGRDVVSPLADRDPRQLSPLVVCPSRRWSQLARSLPGPPS